MTEDRLEKAICDATGNEFIGRKIVDNLEEVYSQLISDVQLREKCADFITENPEESFKRLNVLCKFAGTVRQIERNERLAEKTREAQIEKEDAECFNKFMEKYGVEIKDQKEFAKFKEDYHNYRAFDKFMDDNKLTATSMEELNSFKEAYEGYVASLGSTVIDGTFQEGQGALLAEEINQQNGVVTDLYMGKDTYTNLYDVIDRHYQNIAEFANKKQEAERKLLAKYEKDMNANTNDMKEALSTYDQVIHNADILLNNDVSVSAFHLHSLSDIKDKAEYEKQANEQVQYLFNTGNASKLDFCLNGIREHRNLSSVAAKSFGEITTSRDLADSPEVAKMCDDYPKLALVAIARARQSGEKISTTEQFEAMLDRVENVRAVANNSVNSIADAERIVLMSNLHKEERQYG